MSINIKSKIITALLILSLVMSLIGWKNTYDINAEKIDSLIMEQEDIEEKLDNVIHLKNETILNQDKTIKELNEHMNDKESTIRSKNKKITELKAKVDVLAKMNNQVSKKISRSKSTSNTKTIAFVATAYTAYCEGCSGITATGVNARKSIYHKGHRIIAVDPNIIPLNSLVRVNTGQETFTAIASDTGGAIKGYKIDLLVNSKSEALNFGRKTISVTLLKGGE